MFNFYPSSHNTKCSFPEHTNSTFFHPAFFESKEEHEEKENLFSREKELSFSLVSRTFTLIELLVVIAIIAILASIL